MEEKQFLAFDTLGERMSFGGNGCRSATSLRLHTTSSGKKLLRVDLFRLLIHTTKKRNCVRQLVQVVDQKPVPHSTLCKNSE